MARVNAPLVVFNRGRISKRGLARTDLDRTRLSAETQTNWIPRTLGSMMLRPGLEYIGGIASNSSGRLVPFVFGTTDTALYEITGASTSGSLRVWVDDAVVTRAGSTAAITNGTFSSTNLTGWTDADESGSTSYWVSGNYLGLVGTPFARAIRRQTVTAAAGTHGLATVIERGRVTFKVGSSAGGEDYFASSVLRPGRYSFAITSTGNFFIEVSANTEYASLVDSLAIESSGDMTLTTPWAAADLDKLRWDASADVTFVAAFGYQQRRIERYNSLSYGVAKYEPEDGPFRVINTGPTRLTPSARKGDITLTASQPLFRSGHVGGLFRITSVGQEVSVTLTGTDQWSDSVRVAGSSDARTIDVLIETSTGAFNGTVRLQRSVGEEGQWTNVSGSTWGSSIATTFSDALANQVIFYRIGVGSTFVSTDGTPTAQLTYAGGGITGVGRITAVTGATLASCAVLKAFGSTSASDAWYEGDWSAFRGFPSAVAFAEGRLCWAGKSKIWLSVSDAFESFDDEIEGDSAPLNRSIGSGPVDRVEWLVPVGRLIVGTQGREIQVKTSSLDDPVTNDSFNLKDVSQQGSASVQAVRIDKRAMFVQQGGTRMMETGYAGDSLDYETVDRTILVPEMGEPAIGKLVVQRQPDTRVHALRSNGTVAMLVSDPAENVVCWLDVETGDADGANGVIEDAAVLPGAVEDSVYYLVRREINGSTVRYLEKWARESEAVGGSTNKIADSFAAFSSSLGSTTVTGATHLVGETVVAWGSAAGGVFLGSSFVVSTTGTFQIPSTLARGSTTVYYGLSYPAEFRSAKLAYAAQAGTALTQRKKVNHIGLILTDTHAKGLRFGPSTDHLDPLPGMERMSAVSTDTVHETYDRESIPFPGSYDTDSRIVLVAEAPKPCTVLGAIIQIETNEKI